MKQIKFWTIAGIIFTFVFGTMLHFIYEWSGCSNIAAIFGAVNESTWEHLKLLFWPIFIFSIIEFIFYGNKIKSFIPIKVLSIFVGILSIVSLFYTYSGILGYNVFFIDISIFAVASIISYTFSYKQLRNYDNVYNSSAIIILSVILLIMLTFCFIYFTFNPPKIGLFLDPVTKSYGVNS